MFLSVGIRRGSFARLLVKRIPSLRIHDLPVSKRPSLRIHDLLQIVGNDRLREPAYLIDFTDTL